MSTMTIWQQATAQQLSKRAARARRRNKPLKVQSKKELLWYLNNGWVILAHTPAGQTYSTEKWLLVPAP